ncbi:MAG: ABC transporter permease [Gemmataceae bacterium]
MWQRRLRTLLPIVGVAVGSFVLITSLAVSEGVQDVLVGQLRRQDQLRRILVWPGGGPRETLSEKEIDVPGTMSEGRRDRLREAIKRRRQTSAKRPPPGLSPDQIDAIARLEHVEKITPAFTWMGTLDLDGKKIPVQVRTASEDDAGLRQRRLNGRLFGEQEPAILISEVHAYQMGKVDENQVDSLLTREASLRLAVTQSNMGSLLFLLNVARPDLDERQQQVLGKVIERLPEAVKSLDLSPEDRKVLADVMKETRGGSSGREVERKLPIVGVFRDVARAELGPWDGPPRPVDVLLSPGLAREMYFAVPGRAQVGLPQVSVRVDREENLRSVEEKIKDLGMETFSLAEILDQIRLNLLVIFIACGFIAGIALVVAALGITNTMLMSVMERTFEIGLMKAVGGRDGQVMTLFLTEGAIIGALGAGLGLLGAWLVSFPGDHLARYLVASRTPMELSGSVFVFPWWLVALVPPAVCALTTFAAAYPAWQASRINPITALRRP